MSRILVLIVLLVTATALLLSGCMIHPLPLPGHHAYRGHPGHHVYRPAPRPAYRPHHFYHPWHPW